MTETPKKVGDALHAALVEPVTPTGLLLKQAYEIMLVNDQRQLVLHDIYAHLTELGIAVDRPDTDEPPAKGYQVSNTHTDGMWRVSRLDNPRQYIGNAAFTREQAIAETHRLAGLSAEFFL